MRSCKQALYWLTISIWKYRWVTSDAFFSLFSHETKWILFCIHQLHYFLWAYANVFVFQNVREKSMCHGQWISCISRLSTNSGSLIYCTTLKGRRKRAGALDFSGFLERPSAYWAGLADLYVSMLPFCPCGSWPTIRLMSADSMYCSVRVGVSCRTCDSAGPMCQCFFQSELRERSRSTQCHWLSF